MKPISLLLAMLSALLLTACGGGSGAAAGVSGSSSSSGSSSGSSSSGSSSGGVALTGVVTAGQLPVAAASVTLYAVGTTAAPATVLGTASSDSTGAWGMTGINCPAATTPVYVVASGGSTGDTPNNALRLATALGNCGSLPASVSSNELTSVAAAYTLNPFVTDAGDVRGNAAGLGNAMAMAMQLVSPATGALVSGLGTSHAAAAQRLSALANALSACATSSTAAACVELFHCASVAAVFAAGDCQGGSSTAATDMLAAALLVARDPGTVSVAGVYDVATKGSVYSPSLSAAPGDWVLSLSFANVGLNEPTGVAADAGGNIWFANYNDRVVKLSPSGQALSGSGGFTGGGLHESFGLAIDGSGNVWVINEESGSSLNGGHGSVTKLSPSGSILSGSQGYGAGGIDFPQAVAVDAGGHVWIANGGNSTLSELGNGGAAISPAAGYNGGGLSYPIDLTIDGAGNVWVANEAMNAISELGSNGVALSPASGYTGGGLDVPQGIAVDPHGNIWITNQYGDSVSLMDSSGIPVTGSPFTGGGLRSPGGIAIDGAGRVWVANFNGGSVSELAGSSDTQPGVALSPSVGFAAGLLSQPYSPVIDASGNVWLGSFGNSTATVLIGVASPVATPRIGPPQSP